MKTLVEQLANYATYHRDPRNIATHFVGVPIIVLSVLILLSRWSVDVAGIAVTPALVVFLVSSIFYFKLSLGYGLAMFIVHGALLLVAGTFATASTLAWLSAGVGVFVVGWVIQFVGHYYEGRKPAFVDDMIGLAIGPLFVVAELGFMIGLGKKTQAQVEAIAGPVRRHEVSA
ncbi:MAG TPA: Mpo1-like protein [Limnobacter sp.]|nr:Mpo1-like protein [Limnobacter sp.]